MLRVGVFSDDLGGPMAAILIALGLAEGGDPVTLAAPALPADRRRSDADASSVRMVTLEEGREAERLGGRDLAESDLVVSLGLASLGDVTLTSGLDVSIVVGKGHPAASRALRAARCEPSRGTGVPWFVPFATQSVLRTEATLLQSSIPLPYCTRVLPTTLPRLDAMRENRLLGGETLEEARRTGIILAALSTAAAAMPAATRIVAGDLTRLMEARATAGERHVAARLLRLANAYERIEPLAAPRVATPPRPTERRLNARRWYPARAVVSANADRPAATWLRKPC